jgi:hypothetical protein
MSVRLAEKHEMPNLAPHKQKWWVITLSALAELIVFSDAKENHSETKNVCKKI